MKNIYTLFSYYITQWFQTTSTLIVSTWNFFILNFKSCIVILFIIILNKPFILMILNLIISILIRSVFISTIFACDEDTRFLYEQINDIVREPGEPVYLTDLFKWFLDIIIWQLFLDPPRPPNPIILIPQGSYPNHFMYDTFEALPACRFDNVDEAFWSLPIPDPQPVEEYLEIEIKEVTPKTVIYHKGEPLIKDPLTIKREFLLNTKPDEEPKANINNSYESWAKSPSHLVESKSLFSNNLLRELSYKLLPCRNQDDIFYVSIEFIQYHFPMDNYAQNLADFENPNSKLNLYFSNLEKQMLSTEELVSFFHYKAAGLAYNKACIYNEQDGFIMLRKYYEDNFCEIRAYASKIIKKHNLK